MGNSILSAMEVLYGVEDGVTHVRGCTVRSERMITPSIYPLTPTVRLSSRPKPSPPVVGEREYVVNLRI